MSADSQSTKASRREPTASARIALAALQQEDWDRAENALLEALSGTRRRRSES